MTAFKLGSTPPSDTTFATVLQNRAKSTGYTLRTPGKDPRPSKVRSVSFAPAMVAPEREHISFPQQGTGRRYGLLLDDTAHVGPTSPTPGPSLAHPTMRNIASHAPCDALHTAIRVVLRDRRTLQRPTAMTVSWTTPTRAILWTTPCSSSPWLWTAAMQQRELQRSTWRRCARRRSSSGSPRSVSMGRPARGSSRAT